MSGLAERPLPASLAPVVAAVWGQVTGPELPPRLTLLPDGHTDLLFRFEEFDPFGRTHPPLVTVVGPTATAQVVTPPPRTAFLGVRLRPEAAVAVLRVSPVELLAREVPIADCSPHLRRLADPLAGCHGFEAAAGALVRAIAGLVPDAGRRIDDPVRRAVGLLTRADFGSVAGVARAVGLTERTLHRRVLKSTGLPPKVLARIARFRRAVAAVGGGTPLSQVAVECGYADQSHLCREFRELAGRPPTAWAAGAG